MNCKNITNVSLPEYRDSDTDANRFKTIGAYAFYHTEELQNIIIPTYTSSIGVYAFAYNTSLVKITFKGRS